MAYSVSGLAAYTNEQKLPLLLKAQLGAKSISLFQIASGIKSAEKLNLINTDIVFQANDCAWNASGTTTLSQRTLTVGDIKINEALCPKTLAAKWAQTQLKAGARGEKETMPFEQEFSELKAAGIATALETAVWQGDTTSGTANLSKFDGLLKLIDAATTAVQNNATTGTGTLALVDTDATVTLTGGSFTTMGVVAGDKITVGGVTYTVLSVTDATHLEMTVNSAVDIAAGAFTFTKAASVNFASPYATITTSNANAIMQSMYLSIPTALLDKSSTVIMCGWDTFRKWTMNLTTLNLFHYTAESANGELVLPGTNIKVIALNGLNSTNRMIAGSLENFYFGCDLVDDSEKFEIFFAKEAGEVRFISEFRAGVQVAYPEELVQFTLA